MTIRDGWKRVPIATLYEGLYDGPHGTPPVSEAGPIFLGIGNITDDGHLDLSAVKHIAPSDFPKWTKRVTPRGGDIVFTYEATLNRYAIIPDQFDGCLGRRLALIRPDPSKIDTRFLHYSFFSSDWRETIERNRLSGATVDRIPLSKFPAFPIDVPELPVQRRIAGILSAYDDLIEVNQRRIAILEEMARRLFDEWFTRFRYPGHEAVPLVETELGSVPKGWRVGVFAQCVTVNPETLSPKKAPNRINYIDISSVSVGRVDDITMVDFADAPGRARRVVRDGDIIWSTVRPNRRSHALLLGLEPDTIASTGFAVLRARTEEWAWAYEMSRTDAFVGFLIGRARGAAYPAVVGSDFEEVPTLIPPPELRADFQRRAGPMYESKAALEAQNARLRAARDLLLPKLISGEIDVGRAEEALARAAE